MAAFINNAGKNGNGATTPLTFIEGTPGTPKAVAFVNEYHKKFNENPIAVAVAAAQGYDSLYLLKQAIEQAKSTDGDKIRLALESLQQPFTGLIVYDRFTIFLRCFLYAFTAVPLKLIFALGLLCLLALPATAAAGALTALVSVARVA